MNPAGVLEKEVTATSERTPETHYRDEAPKWPEHPLRVTPGRISGEPGRCLGDKLRSASASSLIPAVTLDPSTYPDSVQHVPQPTAE
jgi:hypothetical protein